MEKKRRIQVLLVLFCATMALVCLSLWMRDRSSAFVLYGNVDIRTVNVSFRVGGRLASLTVDEGDAVQAGQVLGELDNTPHRNTLLQARANVAAKKALLDLTLAGYRDEEKAQVRAELARHESAYRYAKSFYERQRSLKGSKAVSLDDVENARSSMYQALSLFQAAQDKMRQYETGSRAEDKEAARAQFMQADAALAQEKLALEDTVLRAPSSGVVLTRAVEPGTMLSAGNTVFTLSLTRPVWVRAYVDEINLARAVPGAAVKLFIDGRPDRPYTGSIGFVSPTSEFTPKTVQTPELRTDLVYRLRIIVADPDDALRQGMPVTITFAP